MSMKMKNNQIQNRQMRLKIGLPSDGQNGVAGGNGNENGVNNVSKLTNQSVASIYLDNKHQITKEKIGKMRLEEYNKMIAEVKDRPTISKNSKVIVQRIFKDKTNNNHDKKIKQTLKPLHNCHKGKQVKIYSHYHQLNKIEDYKMIIESRTQRINEMNLQKKKLLKRCQRAKLNSNKNRSIHMNGNEELKCQKDKEFNQKYIPYDENIVFNIRDRLQKHYDNKIIPFNYCSQNKGARIDYDKQLDRNEEVGLMQTAQFGHQQKTYTNPSSYNPQQQQLISQRNSNRNNGRREIDIQLLTAFADGLNKNN